MFILFVASQSGKTLQMFLWICQTAGMQMLLTFPTIRQTASLIIILSDRLLFLAGEKSGESRNKFLP